MDAQQRDEMTEGSKDKFFLQYYFPPSSVGETGRVGAPGRREVGHGQLAQRALTPIIPDEVRPALSCRFFFKLDTLHHTDPHADLRQDIFSVAEHPASVHAET